MTVASDLMINLALWETGCRGKLWDMIYIRLQG